MKKILFFIACIPLLAIGCQKVNIKPVPTPKPIACTMEAKLCPDGSFVGRTEPNCEFAACPQPSATSTPPAPVPPPPAQAGGINGYIHAGPTCPVQRIPPDPNCADKPYANAAVVATNASGKQYNGRADAAGMFSLIVPTGTYTVKVTSVNILSRCEQKQTTVTANNFVSVDISCDTGIR